MNNKYAYITLLSSDDYLEGVIGLNYSLQKAQSLYPLIVICTDNLSANTFSVLKENNIQYKTYPNFCNLDTLNYLHTTLNKLHIYDFTEYEKVIFLDGDILVCKNIDYYFDLPFPLGFKYPEFCAHPLRPLCGCTFGIQPSAFIYDLLSQDWETVKSHYETDEPILSLLIPQCTDISDQLGDYLHWVGPDKYWHYSTTIEALKTDIDLLIKTYNTRGIILDCFTALYATHGIPFFQQSYAYVTLVATDAYVLPAIGLYHSWKKTNSRYDFTVMACKRLSKASFDLFKKYNVPVQIIPNYEFIKESLYPQQRRYKYTQGKFYIYNYFNYEKILYLDATMILKQNLDFVFNKPTPSFIPYEQKDMYKYHGYMFLVSATDFPIEQNLDAIMDITRNYANDEACLEVLYANHKTHILFEDAICYSLESPLYITGSHTKYWLLSDYDSADKIIAAIDNNVDFRHIPSLSPKELSLAINDLNETPGKWTLSLQAQSESIKYEPDTSMVQSKSPMVTPSATNSLESSTTRNAVVTLVATNGFVLGGLLTYLAWKQQEPNPNHDFLILVTTKVHKNALQLYDQYDIPYLVVPHKTFLIPAWDRYRHTINKFYIHSLYPYYDKIWYIDCGVCAIRHNVFNDIFSQHFPLFIHTINEKHEECDAITGMAWGEIPSKKLYSQLLQDEFLEQLTDETVLQSLYSTDKNAVQGRQVLDGFIKIEPIWLFKQYDSPEKIEYFVKNELKFPRNVQELDPDNKSQWFYLLNEELNGDNLFSLSLEQ